MNMVLLVRQFKNNILYKGTTLDCSRYNLLGDGGKVKHFQNEFLSLDLSFCGLISKCAGKALCPNVSSTLPLIYKTGSSLTFTFPSLKTP